MKSIIYFCRQMLISDKSWQSQIWDEFEKEYMKNIMLRLIEERAANNEVFPKESDIFSAFNKTPFDKVKIVILGQDPYHGEWQAHGLSFSVANGITPPPSLKNIYKELMGSGEIFQLPDTWNLTHWAEQWVLLLNAILTVRANEAASHKDYGWQQFTDTVISKLSKNSDWLIFMLWWGFAQSKLDLIDQSKHHVLLTSHPSPLSCYRGFLGSGCFKEANKLLLSMKKNQINR